MTLPHRFVIRCHGAGFGLLILAAVLAGVPARADDQQDPYSATVKVDATADSAAAARTIARTDGQRRALENVVQRLSGSSDTPKLPKLDDPAITDMVGNFEVANEKMSTVRYLADYTFHFRPAKIRQLLRSANIAMAETSSKPIVVLPVYRNGDQLVLWDDPNPWRDAWGQATLPSTPTRLALALGEVGDLTAIDAEQARSGHEQALTDFAQRNGADQVLVVIAAVRKDGDRIAGLDISSKRYLLGRLTESRSDTIDAEPGESSNDFFKRAVGVAIAEAEAKTKPAISDKPLTNDKEASLSATIPIASLGDWIELRRKLSVVPGIHAIDLLSLSRHEAHVVIRFSGDSGELKSNLAQADLTLDGAAPDWRLVPAAAATPN